MIKTIDMRVMRYINLFSRISGITPKHCFIYNYTIIFSVPENKLAMAIGDNGKNIKKIGEILNRKVKVVLVPKDIGDAEKFISTIIYPAQIKNVEINGNQLIINAGQQNKAMLIGRNKSRLEEIRKIIKDYFGKEVRII
ncbi:KH domain-containing protein [Candidatus Pacearchaeota archaeon]|nr:KH domain-containing protein [Candidatus Pacearchaeota archaeon]MBI4156873.1 KH domain-containing protein [Candidatus Woesearchaeota archaeon]